MVSGNNTVSKVFALSLIFMLGVTYSQIDDLFQNTFAQSDAWYVGKGVKADTYYTYEIRNAETNQGRPFLMTIYFQEYNSTGKYWIAPAFVVDQGRVYNGTLHLSDLDMTALGSSPIPSEMGKYRSAYATSLDWLSAFVHKPGQSLGSPSWGKIAAIGGSEIKPSGSAKVTTGAGSFDVTVVSYHKGVDNFIYINRDLPYPVKAETFADVTTGKAPIQYAYELKATGMGKPSIPKSQIAIPTPPLTVQTPRGTYNIQLLWEPSNITVGKETKFGVLFMDDNNNIVPRVTFGFKVTDENNKVLTDLKNQKAPEGTGIVPYTFDTPGPKNIQVSIETASGESLDLFVEAADFDIVVT